MLFCSTTGGPCLLSISYSGRYVRRADRHFQFCGGEVTTVCTKSTVWDVLYPRTHSDQVQDYEYVVSSPWKPGISAAMTRR